MRTDSGWDPSKIPNGRPRKPDAELADLMDELMRHRSSITGYASIQMAFAHYEEICVAIYEEGIRRGRREREEEFYLAHPMLDPARKKRTGVAPAPIDATQGRFGHMEFKEGEEDGF